METPSQFIFSPIDLDDLEKRFEKLIHKSVTSLGLIPKEPIKSDDIDFDEALKILKRGKSTVYRLTMQQFRVNDPDPLPYFKDGKFLRFKRSELEAWMKRRLTRPTDESQAALTLAKSAGRKKHTA